MGYSDNPVSVYNLYSPEKELKALVLEVNNTFDERHVYFVTPRVSPEDNIEGKPTKLVNAWSKDFYVSPYNPRGGTYSVAATDAFFPVMTGNGPVNVTLTLRHSDRPYVVARVFSTDAAIDPAAMSLGQKTYFLATWWWVGLLTYPRTLIQAFFLFTRRRMPWIFRPEPLKGTIAKHGDSNELVIESSFRQYLRDAVKNSDMPLTLKYIPSGLLDNAEECMTSLSGGGEEVELRVLTPIFYANFIKYSDSLGALKSEVEAGTISFSSAFALFLLLSQPFQGPASVSKSDNLFFLFAWFLRRNSRSLSTSTTSQFETFLLNTASPNLPHYKIYLLKLLLSDYLALGSIDILDAEIFIIKCVQYWILAGSL